MYLADVCTINCNLAGMPGLSIPCGFDSSGLPIGMQLLGKPFGETTLFELGKRYEKCDRLDATETIMRYETVIGLEVHAQLATNQSSFPRVVQTLVSQPTHRLTLYAWDCRAFCRYLMKKR